jgi:ABC-type dipeptide/oligopeptide/nickel transport system permease component
MLGLLAYRLGMMPLIIVAVVTVLFIIFQFIPGDEATLVAGATATQSEIRQVRHQLGLDRPILVQYGMRLGELAHADLGYSPTFRGNPLPRILERVPATLLLTASAITLAVVAGVPAGLFAAFFVNGWPDFAISAAVVGLLAVPNFWLGMMLIALFAVQLHWLPSIGLNGPLTLIMPTVALAARLIALIGRITRGVVIEEMRRDYVRTARAKGLSDRVTLVRHVLPNALIPIVTVIGLQTGYLLGGSVVVERLFDWPGIGDLLLTAVGLRDYTLVQGITIIFVVGFLLINLAVELLYRLINPRLR